jgi:hypothetical protein
MNFNEKKSDAIRKPPPKPKNDFINVLLDERKYKSNIPNLKMNDEKFIKLRELRLDYYNKNNKNFIENEEYYIYELKYEDIIALEKIYYMYETNLFDDIKDFHDKRNLILSKYNSNQNKSSNKQNLSTSSSSDILFTEFLKKLEITSKELLKEGEKIGSILVDQGEKYISQVLTPQDFDKNVYKNKKNTTKKTPPPIPKRRNDYVFIDEKSISNYENEDIYMKNENIVVDYIDIDLNENSNNDFETDQKENQNFVEQDEIFNDNKTVNFIENEVKHIDIKNDEIMETEIILNEDNLIENHFENPYKVSEIDE